MAHFQVFYPNGNNCIIKADNYDKSFNTNGMLCFYDGDLTVAEFDPDKISGWMMLTDEMFEIIMKRAANDRKR